jgi:plasmid stability protein
MRKQSASIGAMATLYVRNVPADLYAEVQTWAAEAGRSLNAEMIDLIARESRTRQRNREWEGKLRALRSQVPLRTGPPWPEDIIRQDRDRGHKPEFGY